MAAEWKRVREIFELAVDRAADERVRFLDEACVGEAALRREVEELLAEHGRGTAFFDRSPQLLVSEPVGTGSLAVEGQSLGRYEVLSRLGAGGMGEVYLARDPRLGRRVAIKILPREMAADVARRTRFEREARAASALDHPNVCVVHEVAETDDGLHYIVMEHVEGVTLRQHLESGAVPIDTALGIVRQVAGALTAAHAAGIVHRDLKPENLMIRPDGFVKVLDFGLAKLTEAQSGERAVDVTARASQTEPGVVMGTASYMSPEQAKGAHVDARSDVFSFGAVLCELLTGEKAFRRDSNVETMYAILHDEPAGLEALGSRAPAGLVRVMRRCLEKEPERRFQDGKELAEALTQIEARSAPSWGTPAHARVALSRWRRPSLIALGTVLLAGGAWLGFSRPTPDAGSKPASEPPLAAMRTVPLTGLSGKAWDPSFSPNGDRVAFLWTGDANDPNDDIYVKPVDGGTPLRLTTSLDREISPTWSRDGRFIAFVRSSREERSIYMIPSVGGPERKLVTANVASFHGWGARIDWSPDGDSIAYADAAANNRPTSLYRLSVGTLERQQLTSPPVGSIGDQQPAYSPDGTMLAFVRRASYEDADTYFMAAGVSSRVNEFHRTLHFVADVFVVPASGGEPTRLTFDNTVVQGLAWTPDGRSIVFSSDRGGTSGLWRIPAAGGEPEPFGVGGDGAITPAISRQGQRLAYAKPFIIMSTSRVDLPTSPGATGSRTRVLSTTARDAAPRISPDGRRIAFGSSRSGWREIWVCDADGSNLMQMTALGRSSTGSPQWSPDGRSIAFDTRLDEQSDVYVIGADGGAPRRLTDDPPTINFRVGRATRAGSTSPRTAPGAIRSGRCRPPAATRCR